MKKYIFEGISDENINNISTSFKKGGFVVIRNGVKKKTISDLKKHLDFCIKNKKIKNKIRDLHFLKNGKISSAHNLSLYINFYKNFQNLSVIQKLAKKIYGKISKKSFNSSYFAKPKKIGLETKPHQDNAFFCMKPSEIMTFWFPVTFANKTNGGLYYYYGSHNSRLYEHEPKGNLGASMSIKPKELKIIKKKFKKIYINLNKGDFVVHNSSVVHGSNKNTSSFDRNAFNFSIASSRAKKIKKLKENYNSKLKEFLKFKKSVL